MTKFGVAQPVRRVEDPRLLLGQGRYTDDIAHAGDLHAIVLRSPHAAATFAAIDTAAAASLPGVHAIYTARDLEADQLGTNPCGIPLNNRDGTRRADVPHPILASGAVRHVGDPVALVVADTLQAARDAAEAIGVDYDILPSVTDLGAAMDEGQPLVWPNVPNNRCFDWEIGDKARTDALFARAAHVTRLTVVNNRIVVNSMEARAARADYDPAAQKWTLTTNTQGGWGIKQMLADVIFKVPADRIRVVTPDVGGGFGMKLFLYAEHALVCYAARKLNRPVRWASERSEAFLCDTHGRDNITQGELALDAQGTFLAMRTRNVANMGAYLSNYAPFIPTGAGTKVLASVYGFQAIHANVLGVFTNTVPVDAYRGAGRPESNYIVERLIDAAAHELGMDRVAIRRRNMVPPSAMPYRTAMDQTYDSGDFARVMDAALEKMDWANFETRRAASERMGRKRGIGMAYYLEATGGADSERAEIRFAEDGFVDVYVGTQSTGQGHETAYVQLTADQLGIDGDKIRVRQGDTDRGMDILALAAAQRARGQGATQLDAAEVAKIAVHTFPNGCHMAELEVDPETGSIHVVRYIVCDDVGRAVNPMIVRGQVHGGVAQGVGQATMEHTAYDPASGQLLSGSLMDYALPRASDLPDIEVDLVEVPCASNPLGVKGAGEAGAVGSPPAVINALVDALNGRAIDMPATPERVWQTLRAA